MGVWEVHWSPLGEQITGDLMAHVGIICFDGLKIVVETGYHS